MNVVMTHSPCGFEQVGIFSTIYSRAKRERRHKTGRVSEPTCEKPKIRSVLTFERWSACTSERSAPACQIIINSLRSAKISNAGCARASVTEEVLSAYAIMIYFYPSRATEMCAISCVDAVPARYYALRKQRGMSGPTRPCTRPAELGRFYNVWRVPKPSHSRSTSAGR
jgi:hypothetical protein